MNKVELDKIDRKILEVLQNNGRLTNLEVAERVNLSPSPCLRRIRRLEESGVIRQYAALLDPSKIGLGLSAYINVRLEKQGGAPKGKGPSDIFRAAVATWPEVVTCYAMTGEMDYLLKVFVEDMEHFARFIRDQLLAHPAVIDVKSSFALERIKDTTALPVVV
ncbi:MAG: Lrp/AsnC family transcriptional regulator [Ralstonia sp.]|jgi:Lrp/AsnC family leucine-responsive transcriptional regulator|uniref:DNA-binding transcriptional activator DecR n=5 Tax=Ralstonia TaxID=48736 RepID=A0AAD2F4V3_9RALS|nr:MULTISPECIES: Lrp/AsnC family transcriptional regulator [Ralstonia]MEA3268683.1 Lrp/AsnC family transcriptional regulator [Pseudomonadota bacterium]EFP66363.1 transcriptional regulator, AsnC family [Ralstonia pickettii]EGY64936.1 hypothetical protein HMPREF0989_01904 [Ralstonia sp. 5_2_56FAA]ENZ78967.1 transcriptional regulator, AsnC family [Ralstonia pickettii OR214]KFL19098.1 asnC family protein [Ralstonia pickettii]